MIAASWYLIWKKKLPAMGTTLISIASCYEVCDMLSICASNIMWWMRNFRVARTSVGSVLTTAAMLKKNLSSSSCSLCLRRYESSAPRTSPESFSRSTCLCAWDTRVSCKSSFEMLDRRFFGGSIPSRSSLHELWHSVDDAGTWKRGASEMVSRTTWLGSPWLFIWMELAAG